MLQGRCPKRATFQRCLLLTTPAPQLLENRVAMLRQELLAAVGAGGAQQDQPEGPAARRDVCGADAGVCGADAGEPGQVTVSDE